MKKLLRTKNVFILISVIIAVEAIITADRQSFLLALFALMLALRLESVPIVKNEITHEHHISITEKSNADEQQEESK